MPMYNSVSSRLSKLVYTTKVKLSVDRNLAVFCLFSQIVPCFCDIVPCFSYYPSYVNFVHVYTLCNRILCTGWSCVRLSFFW